MAESTNVKVIFEPFPKQKEFLNALLDPNYTVIYYGGAAGGGKTFVGLAGLIMLCKFYPGSVWCVIRKDLPRLKKNTLPSYRKVRPAKFEILFNDYIAHFANGSMIIFANENSMKDPDATWMDGFEPNGFLLEESQELKEYTFKKAKLRAGRNIIEPMPVPKVIVTGNPTQGWPKDTFYEPHIEGKLPEKHKYIQALMSDNPKLPKTYIEALSTLDEITYSRYADGNWDAIDVEKPFMYKFELKKHAPEVLTEGPRKNLPLWLSFDFNKDPITCIVGQVDGLEWGRIYHEFRLENSDIDELCDAIIEWAFGLTPNGLEDFFIMVTGDASGKNGTALKKNLNYYLRIKERLGLSKTQFRIRKQNMGIKNSRVLCNSVMQRHPDLKINRKCKYLIEDCMFVEIKEVAEGIEIDKTKQKWRTHLLDCLRYLLDAWFPNYVKYKV
jgi:hypothetical protein